ncbi:uncharacterized protein LOC127855462 [Dreissena polymorpha]|uniref:YqaJ viral recombinase domain-containing protein n=1 Tax=Dreissena polymorpha TaxID=45954 RepID=A0A9D4HHV6_DREPO|nr:uncharacterized protein LOC127855462 [Dreissena polymorpha]KAH3717963.1 hypothetical protein DPMN_060760 [Dreissena polymorpha]
MAGCGETCTHVAALMFWVSATVKMRDERTVTQKAAYWKPPPNLKNVQYKETSRIDFTSKKNLKRKFNDILAGTPTVTQPVSARKPKKKIPAPTTEELNDFFSALKLSGKKPAVLSIVPGFSDDYVPVVKKVHLPKLLNGLRNKDWDHLYDEEIRDKCCSIFPNICVTDEEVINCEKLTKEQSYSNIWFDLRAGRITASNMKAVCRTDESNPSKSLIKKICYPHDKFSNNATKWGTQNEKKATRQCCEVLSTSHSNLRVEMSGLHISETLSFIAASPDGFVHCDCCGVSCLEVKCPYTKKGMMIDDSVSCLQKNSNGELCLDIDHEYYYQVQTQMGVTGLESCFFVVWTDKDMFIELISFDVKF